MEAAPDSVDQEKLVATLNGIDDVIRIENLHLWSISQNSTAISCNILCNTNRMDVLKKASLICKEDFHISHITIQVQDSEDSIEFSGGDAAITTATESP